MNKPLREGVTTGSCAAAACCAAVTRQLNGICPEMVSIDTPSGKTLHLPVIALSDGWCGIRKDAGDDPDITNGCMVTAQVQLLEKDGPILYCAGDGVGTVTEPGLKLSVGEPAINPVPRKMIEQALRKQIGDRSAVVTISIPGGRELAKRTMNQRLGIIGGLSILGTSGIVRPMSEEAIRDTLRLELSMASCKGAHACAFVMGMDGQRYLEKQYPLQGPIVLCSNYIGDLLDEAERLRMETVLIIGKTGKMVKLAAGIMNTHSKTADGRNEVICTHTALSGASTEQIRQLYRCTTTKQSIALLEQFHLESVWTSIAETGKTYCERRTHGSIEIAIQLLREDNTILAQTKNWSHCIERWANYGQST